MGLLGLLASKCLGIRCTGTRDASFEQQIATGMDNEELSRFVRRFADWFFGCMDEVSVRDTDERSQAPDAHGLNAMERAIVKESVRRLSPAERRVNIKSQ